MRIRTYDPTDEQGVIDLWANMVRPTNTQVISFYRDLGYDVEDRILMSHWILPKEPSPTEES